LLLKNIRETLAGRAFLFELWPLLQSELHPACTNRAPLAPLLDKIIVQPDLSNVLTQTAPVLFGTKEIDSIETENHLLQWGGMPGLLSLPEQQRWKWLKDYCYLYLERDLGDIGFKEGVNGELYETMIVSEIYKWVKTSQLQIGLYFYRTQSGMELDLLLTTDTGVIGMEIKSRETVVKKDWRNMTRIADMLAGEWKGGIVVYRGNQIDLLDADLNIWAVPSRRLFQ
jgi:predicted AAA+ superfamily ATPase